MRKLTTILALAALGSACSAPSALDTRPAADHAATRIPAEPNNPARVAELEKRGKPMDAQILFVGDSITEGWEGAGRDVWRERLEPRKAANYGVSGDQTQNVLWRIARGHFDGLTPKLVVLMIGTNNTGRGQGPVEVADGVAAVLVRLRRKLPGAKILLLGIFPRGEKPVDKMRVNNDEANAILATFADGKQIYYADIGASFLEPDGTISKDVMPDMLHLSARGYRAWADAIASQLEDLTR